MGLMGCYGKSLNDYGRARPRRGLGRAFLCLSVCLPVCLSELSGIARTLPNTNCGHPSGETGLAGPWPKCGATASAPADQRHSGGGHRHVEHLVRVRVRVKVERDR
eukprot:scaffold22207_cov56-Phaeocystis_antarctica.AAC.2